jgi:hypothetical protein
MRRFLLIAFSVLCLFIWISTELLSNAGLLNSSWVLGLWVIFITGGISFVFFFGPVSLPAWPKFSLLEKFLLAGIGLITLVTGITSFLSPVNSHDALNYHIPKIIYWIQQGTVNIFPLALDTHNVYAPFAEYMLLHLYLLSYGDSYLNLLQYTCMLVSLLGLSAIAKELSLSRLGQILTVVFGITLPLGLMEASTVQTDWVGALWAVLFVYFLICYKNQGRLMDLLLLSACLGLGLLSKGTNYLLLIPFGLILWFGLKPQPRFNLSHLCLFLLIVLTINAGYWSRLSAFNTFQNLPANTLLNKDFSLPSLASNTLRHSTMHLSSPWEPLNASMNSVIRAYSSGVGIDLYDNTLRLTHPFSIRDLKSNEDTMTNGLHFLILLGLTCFGLWGLKGPWRTYTLGLVFSWVLFCALVKWQWWGNRFHLGWFLLFAPLFGLAFQNKRVWSFILSVILLGTSFWFITSAQKRPWFESNSLFKNSKSDLMFIYTPELKENCLSITQELNQGPCREIGLLFKKHNVLEYLILYPLLKSGPYQFNHISLDTPWGNTIPCAIICVSCTESSLMYAGRTYSKTINGYFQLFQYKP